MNKKIIIYLVWIFISFFSIFNTTNSFNISSSNIFDVSKQVEYSLTWTLSDPLEVETFTWSYEFASYLPWDCITTYTCSTCERIELKTKYQSFLNTNPDYFTVIASDLSGLKNSASRRCNWRKTEQATNDSYNKKDVFYYDYPYWDENTVFVYNSDWDLTIQKPIWINTHNSLTFSSKYFLYNDIYISYVSDILSYNKINYNDLSTSSLDTRPYPSWFLEPSYIPFPYFDSLWDFKGWLYSCNNNESVCFLSSNWTYFREVIINSLWKLVWPLNLSWNDTKYIFSSDLWNNALVYNTDLTESNSELDFVAFNSERDELWDEILYLTWTTLDIVWNYNLQSNTTYFKDFNVHKDISDDIVYSFDLNCSNPWFQSVSYFADDNKFYCSSTEWDYQIEASDWNFYSSSCYNDIVTGWYICDKSIKSPTFEMAYNPLTGENSWYDPNWWDENNWNDDDFYLPWNWLAQNSCDYFEVVDDSSCWEWEYLQFNWTWLECQFDSLNTPVCVPWCTAYFYLDSWFCASDVLDTDNDDWIIQTLKDIFWIDEDKINDFENSLSWALDIWDSGFSIGSWWTSIINYELWDWTYWEIINRNDNESTCDMFNDDWSFAYYSNGSFDLSIDLNNILNLNYTNKIPFLEELLYLPNKILWFLTNPLQNIFSILRVFGWIRENEYCYFWTIQTIDFQNYLDVWSNFFWLEENFTVWNLTIIDYLILFFIGLALLVLSVEILLF